MAAIQQLKSDEKSTVGTINNKYSENLNFIDSCSWLTAEFTSQFAGKIEPNDSTSFTLKPKGSSVNKGAVRYWGLSPAGGSVGVILAWSAPVSNSETKNKIYVVGGSKSYVDSISWDEVEKSLEESTSPSGSSYGIEASIESESADKTVVVADINFT